MSLTMEHPVERAHTSEVHAWKSKNKKFVVGCGGGWGDTPRILTTRFHVDHERQHNTQYSLSFYIGFLGILLMMLYFEWNCSIYLLLLLLPNISMQYSTKIEILNIFFAYLDFSSPYGQQTFSSWSVVSLLSGWLFPTGPDRLILCSPKNKICTIFKCQGCLNWGAAQWALMWHLTREVKVWIVMSEYARGVRTSPTSIIPFNLWWNSTPFWCK